jgi:hypothetical protein
MKRMFISELARSAEMEGSTVNCKIEYGSTSVAASDLIIIISHFGGNKEFYFS